jgi:hypothetical protein
MEVAITSAVSIYRLKRSQPTGQDGNFRDKLDRYLEIFESLQIFWAGRNRAAVDYHYSYNKH